MNNREDYNLIESNDFIKSKIDAVLIKSDDKKIEAPLEKVKQGKNKKDIRYKTLKANSHHAEMITDVKVDTIDIPCKQAKIIELPRAREEMKTTVKTLETRSKKLNTMIEKMKQIKSELNQSNKSLEDKNKELRKMKKYLGDKQKIIQQKKKALREIKMEIKKKNSKKSDEKVELKTKNRSRNKTNNPKKHIKGIKQTKEEVKVKRKTAKTINIVSRHKKNKNVRLLKFGERSLYLRHA